ncbi:hypothetical protein D3C72_2133070 [compost metagenome]
MGYARFTPVFFLRIWRAPPILHFAVCRMHLHFAVWRVYVGVVACQHLHVFVDQLAARICFDVQQVPILDRVLIRPKLELSAHAGKIGFAQRGAEVVGAAGDVAVDGF